MESPRVPASATISPCRSLAIGGELAPGPSRKLRPSAGTMINSSATPPHRYPRRDRYKSDHRRDGGRGRGRNCGRRGVCGRGWRREASARGGGPGSSPCTEEGLLLLRRRRGPTRIGGGHAPGNVDAREGEREDPQELCSCICHHQPSKARHGLKPDCGAGTVRTADNPIILRGSSRKKAREVWAGERIFARSAICGPWSATHPRCEQRAASPIVR